MKMLGPMLGASLKVGSQLSVEEGEEREEDGLGDDGSGRGRRIWDDLYCGDSWVEVSVMPDI
jgi:hypothetical protein